MAKSFRRKTQSSKRFLLVKYRRYFFFFVSRDSHSNNQTRALTAIYEHIKYTLFESCSVPSSSLPVILVRRRRRAWSVHYVFFSPLWLGVRERAYRSTTIGFRAAALSTVRVCTSSGVHFGVSVADHTDSAVFRDEIEGGT